MRILSLGRLGITLAIIAIEDSDLKKIPGYPIDETGMAEYLCSSLSSNIKVNGKKISCTYFERCRRYNRYEHIQKSTGIICDGSNSIRGFIRIRFNSLFLISYVKNNYSRRIK